MPNYRRSHVPGGTYFFTLVTYRRRKWLCTDIVRAALRETIVKIRATHPFKIDAFVLLPDHLHCVWTLPEGDMDYSIRWRLIKSDLTRNCADRLPLDTHINASREKRKERHLWQRRFLEHLIRDDEDFARHCDYIHYNPVKHGFCHYPEEWPYSSFHRFVAQGIYAQGWGGTDDSLELPYDV